MEINRYTEISGMCTCTCIVSFVAIYFRLLIMNVECTKEDNEPSYDNLTTTVGATKKTSKSYGIRQIVTKPIFKWTVLVTIVTVLTIIIVVPTVLEITKEGNNI